MIRKALALVAALSLPLPAAALECHTAIVFALDASRSVDNYEGRLQREGLANALRDPVVQAAIYPFEGSGIVATAFEWSNPDSQVTIAPWAILDGPAAVEAFAQTLVAGPGLARRLKTGIGAALRYAGAAHRAAPAACQRRVIDVSGDGPGNAGVLPRTIKAKGEVAGIIINGLVIRHPEFNTAHPPDKDPLRYYRERIIQGPGAFVVVAETFEEYAEAIRTKLLRELTPAVALR